MFQRHGRTDGRSSPRATTREGGGDLIRRAPRASVRAMRDSPSSTWSDVEHWDLFRIIDLADAHLEYFWYVLESCLCSHVGWLDKTDVSTHELLCSEKTAVYSIVYIIICALCCATPACVDHHVALRHAEFSSLVELSYRKLGDQPSLALS